MLRVWGGEGLLQLEEPPGQRLSACLGVCSKDYKKAPEQGAVRKGGRRSEGAWGPRSRSSLGRFDFYPHQSWAQETQQQIKFHRPCRLCGAESEGRRWNRALPGRLLQ